MTAKTLKHSKIVLLILCFSTITKASLDAKNSSSTSPNHDSNNHQHNQNLSLEQRLELQKSTFHWYPYQRILYTVSPEGLMIEDEECPERPSAKEEFPDGFFTREQRLYGIFLIHIFIAVYCFITLAFICDMYFLPTIERICDVLDISQDVAATTFMATATTVPEFFTNTISTFIAGSDMGLSAIIGSMLFNTLGVAACASLFIKKPIQIDWWPITRDSLILSIHLSVLIIFSWDGAIMWWEAMILVFILIFYWILMFQNKRLVKFVKRMVEDRLLWCQRIKNYDIVNQRPKSESQATFEAGSKPNGLDNPSFVSSNGSLTIPSEPENQQHESLWELPKDVTTFQKFWFFFSWPSRFLLHYTIPDPMRHKRLYPLSFLACILWIAGMSWVVFFMVVLIGDTFRIPDPVMAMTFLAFGGCMPEAISAVIVARKGSGQMGVSNALGANSLAITFSLGMPWFIRTMADGAWWTGAYIRIYSFGVEFTLIGLVFAVMMLYIAVSSAGYKLRKTVGAILFIGYLGFATFAILVELDVLFEATC